jgi:hypothetical protein
VLKNISKVESKLGIPEFFILDLRKEDDWSFIIKLNALFEAAATEALVIALNCPKLEDSLSFLDFGNDKFGKVKLLKNLGCIDQNEAKFLQLLFELRNKLAHNIKLVGFTFKSYIASMDSNQKKSFITKIKCGKEMVLLNYEKQPIDKYVTSHTKDLILLAAVDLLISLQQVSE